MGRGLLRHYHNEAAGHFTRERVDQLRAALAQLKARLANEATGPSMSEVHRQVHPLQIRAWTSVEGDHDLGVLIGLGQRVKSAVDAFHLHLAGDKRRSIELAVSQRMQGLVKLLRSEERRVGK